MSGDQDIYFRIKRRNQTYCLLFSENETVLSLKEQIAAAVSQQYASSSSSSAATATTSEETLTPEDIQLISKQPDVIRLILEDQSTVLDDSTPLKEYHPVVKKREDCVLYVVFPVADGEWESIDILSTDMQE